MDEITESEKKRVKDMYDCEENPFVYQIKPKGTFDIIESRKITKEDLKS